MWGSGTLDKKVYIYISQRYKLRDKGIMYKYQYLYTIKRISKGTQIGVLVKGLL